MTSGAFHNQYEFDRKGRGRFSRAGADLVEARAGNRYRSRSSAGPGNGPARASEIEGSPSNTFAGVAPSQASAIARGRMGSPARVSAARTQLQLVQPALDSAAGEAAPCPCGRVEGAIAPRASGERPETPGLNSVCQGVGPWVVRLRNHNAYPTSARPACRDGGTIPFLSFRVAFEQKPKMNRLA